MAAFDEEDLIYTDAFVLPSLFNLDKKGKERLWKVWSKGSSTFHVQGLVDGKKQTGKRDFFPKNVGRSNETSGEEQAKREAESMWVKKLEKGYLPKCEAGKEMLENIKKAISDAGGKGTNATAAIRGRDAKNTKTRDTLAPKTVVKVIKPMKAEKWSEEDKVLKYFNFKEGFYLQRKFDGIRCAARLQIVNGVEEVVMTTNNLKHFPWFGKLRDAILKFLHGKNYLDGLDGELYVHHLFNEKGVEYSRKAQFSQIQSICAVGSTEPHILEDQIRFYVFDLVDLSGEKDQDERFKVLKKLFQENYGRKNMEKFDAFQYDEKDSFLIKMCDVVHAKSTEEVEAYCKEVSQEGFEGIIIRAKELRYSQTRSYQLRKYKYFDDGEFPIIDAIVDPGVAKHNFVWVCIDPHTVDPKTKQPIQFRVKQSGTIPQRTALYAARETYIGSYLTVQYQDRSADGIPRFPTVPKDAFKKTMIPKAKGGIRDDQ